VQPLHHAEALIAAALVAAGAHAVSAAMMDPYP